MNMRFQVMKLGRVSCHALARGNDDLISCKIDTKNER